MLYNKIQKTDPKCGTALIPSSMTLNYTADLDKPCFQTSEHNNFKLSFETWKKKERKKNHIPCFFGTHFLTQVFLKSSTQFL